MMPIVPWPHIGRQPLVSMKRMPTSASARGRRIEKAAAHHVVAARLETQAGADPVEARHEVEPPLAMVAPRSSGAPPATSRTGLPAVWPSMQKNVERMTGRAPPRRRPRLLLLPLRGFHVAAFAAPWSEPCAHAEEIAPADDIVECDVRVGVTAPARCEQRRIFIEGIVDAPNRSRTVAIEAKCRREIDIARRHRQPPAWWPRWSASGSRPSRWRTCARTMSGPLSNVAMNNALKSGEPPAPCAVHEPKNPAQSMGCGADDLALAFEQPSGIQHQREFRLALADTTLRRQSEGVIQRVGPRP